MTDSLRHERHDRRHHPHLIVECLRVPYMKIGVEIEMEIEEGNCS